MSTLVALMGAALVPATCHNTVLDAPAIHSTLAVLGEETTKGPAAFTVMAISSKHTPPPPALLSLAVSLKLIGRAYEGNISPMVVVLFN